MSLAHGPPELGYKCVESCQLKKTPPLLKTELTVCKILHSIFLSKCAMCGLQRSAEVETSFLSTLPKQRSIVGIDVLGQMVF